MCVANSARSQIAEGLAKNLFGPTANVMSAGSVPKYVNPFAIKVLQEVGIHIESHSSKSIQQLPQQFVAQLDYVITLCAEEVCPILPSKTAKKLHWPLPDPAGDAGTDEEKLARFRVTRESISERLKAFRISLGVGL